MLKSRLRAHKVMPDDDVPIVPRRFTAECQESVDQCLNCRCTVDSCDRCRRYLEYGHNKAASAYQGRKHAKTYEHKGGVYTIAELAEMYGIRSETLRKRIDRLGYDKAMTWTEEHGGKSIAGICKTS